MAKQLRKKFVGVTVLAFAFALSTGVAVANVTANAAEAKADFAITATSIRLDDPAKEGVDSGLRFKVDVPVAQAEVTNAYTTLTVTPVGGTKVTTNVPATVWRTDGSGWNTVLLDIPSTDYVTEVTAQAFATIDGVVYETEAVTMSIAKTAAKAIATGVATEAEAGHYVSLDSLTLDKESAIIDGETLQLTATTPPAGYAVKFTSSDEAVATVDANGVVTGVGGGRATITASMGGKEATCEVLVTGAGTIVDFNNGSPMISGYTTAGNGSAIQSYYGSTASDSTLSVGYSGQTSVRRILYTTAGGLTGEANDKALAFNFFWKPDDNGSPWKFGFAVAWLDAVFADLHVSAMQWSMMLPSGVGATGVSAEVAQSWTDDFAADGAWHTLTMTREDYFAIKTGTLEVNGFFTMTIDKSYATYTSAFWFLMDEFQVVYSAEEGEEPPAPAPVLTLDFNDLALGTADSAKYYLSGNATADDSVTIDTHGYGDLVNADVSADEKALKFYMSANTVRQYMYVNIVLTDDMKNAIANGATLSFAYAINRCKSSQYLNYNLLAGANGGSATQELVTEALVGYDGTNGTWGPRPNASDSSAVTQWATVTITDATVLSELASTGILQITVDAYNWGKRHETNFWIDNITVVNE